jgi:CHAT domain-containing protein
MNATTILLGVDETVLNLPWELMTSRTGVSMLEVPFGRIVTTRQVPKQRRDPLKQDDDVRMLVVVNPTSDLASTASELESLKKLEDVSGSYRIKVDVLEGEKATKKRFKESVAEVDYDMIHFAGHGNFDPSRPERSALHFADGRLESDEIHALPWPPGRPPGFVFNSACESGRAAGGRRLVGKNNRANGLAAAFLASGVGGYAGYFWPVSDVGAALFAQTFYEAAFRLENIGLGFMMARQETFHQLGDKKDLTCFSAVLFGDAAAGERQDLMMAE